VTPQSLFWEELAGSPLGDVRRNRRAAVVTAALSDGGGRSVASAMGTWSAVKGCSRLLTRPAMEHAALMEGHVQRTIERARAHPVVLAVQDTSTFSYGQREEIEGLGPVDSELSVQGFLAHTTLLVVPEDGEVLGVAHQKVWVRSWTAHPKTETAAQRKKRARESQHWGEGQEALARAMGRARDPHGGWSAPAEGLPRVIAVFDSEGDIFEAFETLHELGHGYVIRATRSRSLVDRGELSLDAVLQSAVLGTLPFEVPRKQGQPVRTTTLTVRATTVRLRPPCNRGRKGEPLEVQLVLVQEEQEPEQGERLCWYLVTTEPASTFEQACAVIRLYRFRWRIEEFHMGLKTGCGMERAQLHSLHALENLLALASIATWRLLALRDAARDEAPTPPDDTLTTLQLQLLRHHFPKLPLHPSAREVHRAIAMLGGFLGRKADGQPGWRTLWRGYHKLLLMEEGAQALLPRSG
jgi:hypothetical protein